MKILGLDDRLLRPVAHRGVKRSESAIDSTATIGRASPPMLQSSFDREDALLTQPAKTP